MDRQKYRNLTAHTYREKLAVEVTAFVRTRAIGGFDTAVATLRARADE